MLTFSLQSGSNGNAIYVEAGDVRLLFDAGISGVEAERRMQRHGRDIRDVCALIISHEHRDHVCCAGVYQRKFRLPIYITPPTLAAISREAGRLGDVRFFFSGQTLEFGPVRVYTIRTPHDACDGVAFVVEHDGRRLGILTDLGHRFDGLAEIVESVDAAYLEFNHDAHLLRTGSYAPRLKARIAGPGGHLSNDDAAALVAACGRNRPAWIAMAHLSGENNTPEHASATVRERVGADYPAFLAGRHDVSAIMKC